MNALAAHALWAATYDETPNPLLALEQRITLPMLPDVSGRVVADIGCGTGRWTRELGSRGARTIAVDRCSAMLVRAPGPAVVADAAQLPFPDESVHVTVCAFALSYTRPCLNELARITRPGGTVIVSDMHPAAAECGWTRTFRAGGERISIAATPYSLDSLRSSSLRLEQLTEAPFGPPEFELFLRAGRPELFDKVRGVKAVFAAKWVRHGD
jgi:malonyl-CoA O-methyltransferase